MRKVFHFDSPADPYVADAAVLCCFDHRISTAVRKFLKKQGIEHPDMITVAGGAKAQLLADDVEDRLAALEKEDRIEQLLTELKTKRGA